MSASYLCMRTAVWPPFQIDEMSYLEAARRHRQQVAEWSRPVFADERPVYITLPTFEIGPRRHQTAVTLNRSQRSSTCRGLSFSAQPARNTSTIASMSVLRTSLMEISTNTEVSSG